MLLVAVRDLLFASKIDSAARRLGVAVAWAPRHMSLASAAEERRPQAILADLSEAGALGEVRTIRERLPEARIVGFLGHLQADLIDQARSLGVEEVLTRGQLAASLDDVLLRAAGCARPPAG